MNTTETAGTNGFGYPRELTPDERKRVDDLVRSRFSDVKIEFPRFCGRCGLMIIGSNKKHCRGCVDEKRREAMEAASRDQRTLVVAIGIIGLVALIALLLLYPWYASH